MRLIDKIDEVINHVRVRRHDPLWKARLRLVYLVPILVIGYPIAIVAEGVSAVGTPLKGARDVAYVWKYGGQA